MTVDDVLDRYTPDRLPDAAWRLARPAVLAAVRATGPTTDRSARQRASVLCGFLAAHPTWDRETPPDLPAWVTRKAVEDFVAHSDLSDSAKYWWRHALRIVAAAVDPSSVPVAPTARQMSGAASTAFWRRAVGLSPFPALVAAYCSTGRRFHGEDVYRLPELTTAVVDLTVLLPQHAPTAAVCDGITLEEARNTARTLASIKGVQPKEVSLTSTSPSAKPTQSSQARPKAAKRPSRAAVLRAAREAQSAAAAPASPRELPADVVAAIEAYKPNGFTSVEWSLVKDATQALLTAYEPPNAKAALSNAGGHICRYVLWVATRPGREDPTAAVMVDEAKDIKLVNEYIQIELASMSDGSRATKRSVLRRAVLGQVNASRAQSLAYPPIQGPYTPVECAAFVRLARNQSTSHKRRELSAVVALGLGAGLDGRDQRRVTPADIQEVDLGDGSTVLMVAVAGTRPRTVVVSNEYADLLREAVKLHREDGRSESTPLHGVLEDRGNVITPVVGRAVTATGEPVELKAARLRSTWLVAAMCARVPLATLMNAAGLKSARSLADLLPHCPEPDSADVAAVLAAIKRDGGPA